MNLKEISLDIRNVLQEKREELGLVFFEDEHIYHMKDKNGVLRSDYPSVSKVYKKFYIPFDGEKKSLEMCNGDVVKQKELLIKWESTGTYATNLGSRVHYLLETDLIDRYGNYKEVRQPIFECDNTQINKSDNMIIGGKEFLNLMEKRGAVLLDTEMVLGDPELGYTGQPDKVWLMLNKDKTTFGLVITDWKSNQPRKFQIQPYTGKMLPPFQNYPDTDLSHYYIQLPLYGKLLLKMLQGTKYSDIKLLGCVVVLVKDDTTFEEFKVPQDVVNTVLTMDLKNY